MITFDSCLSFILWNNKEDWVSIWHSQSCRFANHSLNSFNDIERALLSQLWHAFTHCYDLRDRMLIHSFAEHDILLTSLLFSKLLDWDWKYCTLKLIEKILSNHLSFESETLYLWMFARQRRRDLLRRISNTSIESVYEKLFSIDSRTNALYDEHLRSNA